MGTHMARNLHRAGLLTGVWNRTSAKATALAEELKCHAFASLAELAGNCEAVVICVSADDDLRAVVAGLDAGLSPNMIVIDCSTVGSATAREMYDHLAGLGVSRFATNCIFDQLQPQWTRRGAVHGDNDRNRQVAHFLDQRIDRTAHPLGDPLTGTERISTKLRARAKTFACAGQHHSTATGFAKYLVERHAQIVEQAAAERIVSLGIIECEDHD